MAAPGPPSGSSKSTMGGPLGLLRIFATTGDYAQCCERYLVELGANLASTPTATPAAARYSSVGPAHAHCPDGTSLPRRLHPGHRPLSVPSQRRSSAFSTGRAQETCRVPHVRGRVRGRNADASASCGACAHCPVLPVLAPAAMRIRWRAAGGPLAGRCFTGSRYGYRRGAWLAAPPEHGWMDACCTVDAEVPPPPPPAPSPEPPRGCSCSPCSCSSCRPPERRPVRRAPWRREPWSRGPRAVESRAAHRVGCRSTRRRLTGERQRCKIGSDVASDRVIPTCAQDPMQTCEERALLPVLARQRRLLEALPRCRHRRALPSGIGCRACRGRAAEIRGHGAAARAIALLGALRNETRGTRLATQTDALATSSIAAPCRCLSGVRRGNRSPRHPASSAVGMCLATPAMRERRWRPVGRSLTPLFSAPKPNQTKRPRSSALPARSPPLPPAETRPPQQK